ncbi:MAG TPA: hypothetical protein VLF63_00790 [Patescibacteria group bacterium]|nr:hypothetical protein [Patescibacteria group bacterium]
MKNRQELLAEIKEALEAKVITESDINAFITPQSHSAQIIENEATEPTNKPDKLSAVDVMFYIAGLVLFSAIMSAIVQSWNGGSAIVHILLSAGVGVGMWAIAYYLINNSIQNDIRKGLINSLLLTGSLSVIVGGYIITNELIGGFSEVNLIPGAIMLAVLGSVHIGFDRLVKRDLTILMGIFLCVASFPSLLFGILQGGSVSTDIWSIIVIASAGLLAYATRVVAKITPDRQKIKSSFDGFASFLALATMYISSFGNSGVLWLILLIAGVFGIFYISIVTQNKHLLGSASFFLVLTVITIAFKYFSGFGITFSLICATVGLLGSAAVASGINKKYFKQSKVMLNDDNLVESDQTETGEDDTTKIESVQKTDPTDQSSANSIDKNIS